MILVSTNINGEQNDFKMDDRFDFRDRIKIKIVRLAEHDGDLQFANLEPDLGSIEAGLSSRGTVVGDFVLSGGGRVTLGKILINHVRPEIRSKEMIMLRFHKSEKLKELNGKYAYFKWDNDIREIPGFAAKQILEDHGDNFEVLAEYELLEYGE